MLGYQFGILGQACRFKAARGGIRADYMKWPDAEPAAFVAGIARRSMLMEKDTHGIFRADRDAA